MTTGSSATRVFGKLMVVLKVMPSLASAAAHKPERLGDVKTNRQGMPAASSASTPAVRNVQGGSNAINGKGSEPRLCLPGQSG